VTGRPIGFFSLFLVALIFLGGCATTRQVDMSQLDQMEADEEASREQKRPEPSPPPRQPAHPPQKKTAVDKRWTERVITEKEISKLSEKDPELTPVACSEILARLNTKARFYIPDDIRHKRKLRVPRDFSAYKNWTPMPTYIREAASLPKFILIAKDIPFLGWYQGGKLIGDTQICIGKMFGWTKAGVYRILDKDPNHISNTYTNAFGEPAPMPYALRIYDRVWIHMGDVIGGYCSHGCINLPMEPSEKVYEWADKNTMVAIVDSVHDTNKMLGTYLKQIKPVASKKKKKTTDER
jgi:hypothetical protein